MSDCNLNQRDDGRWYCPTCDPGQQRPLPVPARRNCDKQLAATTKHPTPTKQLVAQARALRRRQPGDAVDEDEIRRRVAVCAGCDEFVAQVPACEERLDGRTPCEVTRRLVVRITRGTCRRWGNRS
ncbi:MAG: hypothetical protein ACYSUI_07660 [Planctomycetota bacterium]